MTNILVYNQEIKSFDLNSIFDYVERKYDVSRNSIKEYLKVNKRIEKCKNDIFFITTCLQNNTMPITKHILHTYVVVRDYHMNTFYFIYFNFK